MHVASCISRIRTAAVTLALSTALLSTGVASAQEAVVNMETLTFVPKELQVAAGTTVVWPNISALGHTVTSDDGLFDSGLVNPGDTFAFTFDTPGVYQYFCVPHGSAGLGGMAGVIVVGDPAPAEGMAPESEPAAPAPEEQPYVPDH